MPIFLEKGLMTSCLPPGRTALEMEFPARNFKKARPTAGSGLTSKMVSMLWAGKKRRMSASALITTRLSGVRTWALNRLFVQDLLARVYPETEPARQGDRYRSVAITPTSGFFMAICQEISALPQPSSSMTVFILRRLLKRAMAAGRFPWFSR